MSAITSRPRITGIVVTAAAGTVVTGAALAAGLIRAAGSAARAARRQLEAARQTDSIHLLPLCALRRDRHSRSPVRPHVTGSVPSVDAVKLDAAARIGHYVLTDASRLTAPLRSLETAVTIEQARVARDALLVAVEAEHQRGFTDRLVAACSRASAVAGFGAVETRAGANGATRIVATNDAGQALVTEIHAAPDREPSLETEVVGLHDRTCNEILDRFDSALDAEGVRADAPRRTYTGGVCELTAAREFVRRKLRPKTEAKAKAQTGEKSTRRRSRSAHRQPQR